MSNLKTKEYNYGDGYFPKLFIKDGKIVDARCKCVWGKVHENAFKEGDTLCNHLVASMKEYYLETRNKKKEPREMLGLTKCPEWLKTAYKKAVDYTCEDCGKKEPEIKLEVHRIIQGYKGGKYRPGNVKMLCTKCHQKYAEQW